MGAPSESLCTRGDNRQRVTGLLCRTCSDQATRALREAPDLWEAMEQCLGPNQGATSGKVSGTTDPHTAFNAAAGAARDHLAGALTSWSRVVAEERGITPPRLDGDIITVQWLRTTAEFLSRHHDWCCAQPWASEWAAELDSTWRAARKTAYPNPSRRFPAATHPECGGTLWAVLRPADDLLPASLVCDRCRTELTSDRWYRDLGKGEP